MENKVLYNLDKIISVYVYKKKVNRWFEDFKPKGYYWWKIFGVIPLFKYHLEHNTNNIFVNLFCGSCSVIQNVPILLNFCVLVILNMLIIKILIIHGLGLVL